MINMQRSGPGNHQAVFLSGLKFRQQSENPRAAMQHWIAE